MLEKVPWTSPVGEFHLGLAGALGRRVVTVGGQTNRPVDGGDLITDDGWVRSAGLQKMREAP